MFTTGLHPDKGRATFGDMSTMIKSPNTEPMVAGERHHNRTATRFACNHDWNRRGDNTKSKEQK